MILIKASYIIRWIEVFHLQLQDLRSVNHPRRENLIVRGRLFKVIIIFMKTLTRFKKCIIWVTYTNLNSFAFAALLMAAVSQPSSFLNAKEMKFELRYLNHTNAIIADGDITINTPSRFKEFMKTAEFDGFNFEVWLNSDGGNLLAGLALGAAIRAEGFLNTRVYSEYMSARCYSACAYVFMGGRERELSEDTSIGFHQFFSGQNTVASYDDLIKKLEWSEASTQLLSAIVLKYLLEMGGHVDLFYRTVAALPGEMFIPQTKELLPLGVITTRTFHDFHLEPYKNGVVAYAKNQLNASGRQVITQITTLCDKNQKIILLSGSEGYNGFSKLSIERFEKELSSFSIIAGGRTWIIPYEKLQFYQDSNVMLGILIPDHIAKLLLTGDFRGSWTIPAGMGPRMYFHAETNGESQKMIQASFRHCYR